MIGVGAGAGGGGGGGRPGLPLQPRGAPPGHAEEELHGQVPSSSYSHSSVRHADNA